MIVMAVCAVICGTDDFVAIARYVRTKKDCFSQFPDLSNGVPSHDHFDAVFGALRPAEFERCLVSWITSLHQVSEGQIIAVDGKTLRGSYDKGSSKAAIHMVSAWATANHISLGQVITAEKSNEITAIPELLKLIEIKGGLITTDAMGCQTEISATIVEERADYCLEVRRNQPTLYDGIDAFFAPHLDNDFSGTSVRRHVEHETTHGRRVNRYSLICRVSENLPDADRWRNLRAIGVVVSITQRNGRDYVSTSVTTS